MSTQIDQSNQDKQSTIEQLHDITKETKAFSQQEKIPNDSKNSSSNTSSNSKNTVKSTNINSVYKTKFLSVKNTVTEMFYDFRNSKRTEKAFYVFSFFSFVSLIFSLFFSFVSKDDYKAYLVHFFNPTNVPFEGKIQNYLGFILPILSVFTLIVDYIPVKKKNKNEYINLNNENIKVNLNNGLKFSLFLSYVFTIENFFRVIYPEGFLHSLDVSNLNFGFYSFVFFNLFYLITIASSYFIQTQKNSKLTHININTKKENNIRKIVKILVFITTFCTISLIFIPLLHNYKSYMIEEGFKNFLDKRTSVKYFMFGMLDEKFNLSLTAFLTIYFNVNLLTFFNFTKKFKSYLLLLITSVLSIFSVIITLTVATNASKAITPILVVRFDESAIFFITVLFLVNLLTLIFSSVLIALEKKKINKYGKNYEEKLLSDKYQEAKVESIVTEELSDEINNDNINNHLKDGENE